MHAQKLTLMCTEYAASEKLLCDELDALEDLGNGGGEEEETRGHSAGVETGGGDQVFRDQGAPEDGQPDSLCSPPAACSTLSDTGRYKD